MRIALFSGNYNYLREGANQALNSLVRYLEEKAIASVRVYSPVTKTPAFEPAGTLVPVGSVALPVRSEFRLALGLSQRLRRDIRQFRPDIVHVSTPDILGVRAQTFARQLGVPIVASMHTSFEKYLGYYRLDWLRPVVTGHLDRFYRRSDHVLAPTQALVDDLRVLRGDDAASVWSRGIDADHFHPDRRDPAWRRQRGIRDDEIVVLFLGRLVLEKGIGAFVETIIELNSRDCRVRPLIVGAGPADQQFAVLPDVVTTGHLHGLDLARAIASADILLCPSTTETFGNVIVEAMASGLPVVSADAQNSRSILTDGVDGILCRPDIISDYVAALTGLINDSGLRQDMGRAARRKSMIYSWDRASESVADVYAALLAASDNRSKPHGAPVRAAC